MGAKVGTGPRNPRTHPSCLRLFNPACTNAILVSPRQGANESVPYQDKSFHGDAFPLGTMSSTTTVTTYWETQAPTELLSRHGNTVDTSASGDALNDSQSDLLTTPDTSEITLLHTVPVLSSGQLSAEPGRPIPKNLGVGPGGQSTKLFKSRLQSPRRMPQFLQGHTGVMGQIFSMCSRESKM
ncbi:hypothetical protein HPG69_009561 [Diceros bicornis minor]|uniref:Uncharacterized protein n=1 Tax=Diceros bicornis minor TaxID=77932 RepID=A0A7J7EMH7_DICBM|nr:hypothetical protein HPG69_009561 [Diceros bicornis minor]